MLGNRKISFEFNNIIINMSNKLYIVIDVQNDFVSGSLGSPWAVATTEKIAKFLESVKDNP